MKPEKVHPIKLFVTGCTGAGKSHLTKPISHTAAKTFQYGTMNPDRPTVALATPTGVATININSTTYIHPYEFPKNLEILYSQCLTKKEQD